LHSPALESWISCRRLEGAFPFATSRQPNHPHPAWPLVIPDGSNGVSVNSAQRRAAVHRCSGMEACVAITSVRPAIFEPSFAGQPPGVMPMSTPVPVIHNAKVARNSCSGRELVEASHSAADDAATAASARPVECAAAAGWQVDRMAPPINIQRPTFPDGQFPGFRNAVPGVVDPPGADTLAYDDARSPGIGSSKVAQLGTVSLVPEMAVPQRPEHSVRSPGSATSFAGAESTRLDSGAGNAVHTACLNCAQLVCSGR
jgi:hypothetical protein